MKMGYIRQEEIILAEGYSYSLFSGYFYDE